MNSAINTATIPKLTNKEFALERFYHHQTLKSLCVNLCQHNLWSKSEFYHFCNKLVLISDDYLQELNEWASNYKTLEGLTEAKSILDSIDLSPKTNENIERSSSEIDLSEAHVDQSSEFISLDAEQTELLNRTFNIDLYLLINMILHKKFWTYSELENFCNKLRLMSESELIAFNLWASCQEKDQLPSDILEQIELWFPDIKSEPELEDKRQLLDYTLEEGAIEDETVEDETVEDEIVEDEIVEDEIVEDEIVEDEIVEDEIVEDEIIEDEIIEDEIIEDEIIEDEIIEDENRLDETINPTNSEVIYELNGNLPPSHRNFLELLVSLPRWEKNALDLLSTEYKFELMGDALASTTEWAPKSGISPNLLALIWNLNQWGYKHSNQWLIYEDDLFVTIDLELWQTELQYVFNQEDDLSNITLSDKDDADKEMQTLEPIELDTIELDASEEESKLYDIFSDEEAEPQDEDEGSSETLDPKYWQILEALMTKVFWTKDEFNELCQYFDVMPNGIIEILNDWAFNWTDEKLIDENENDQSIEIDTALARDILA